MGSATANGAGAGGKKLAADALEKVKAAGLLKAQNLVNGKWVDAENGETIAVTNPATGETVQEVAHGAAKETSAAIDAAAEAFKIWSAKSAKERSKFLRAWFNAIMESKEELALLMTLEQGKPLKESQIEVEYGAGFIDFYSEEAIRAYGDIIPAPTTDKKIFVIQQPVGVVGIITPWNFPIAMITRKVGPALAAGCTVVIKPAELTPLCALALGELANRVGIPPGVINIVVGASRPIGETILNSDKVMKLSFTGSTAVGKSLMAQAAQTVKKVSLELGGNAPVLVFDDADLDKAVKGAMATKFRNSGQTCVCANRILVQDGVYDKFAELFAKAAEGLKVGNGLDEGVTQGPLINEKGVEKARSHVEDALKKGAKVITGGKGSSLGPLYYEPTVIVDVPTSAIIAKEEVFAPVAPLFRFKTEAEAIGMANDTEFGLASYIYTEGIARGFRVAEALQYGMVGFNETAISTEVAPFGGWKQSGLGREGSKYGMDDYMEKKYICLGGLNPVLQE